MAERIKLMDDREIEQITGGAYTGSVFVYTVQEGESLSVLAHRFGTSVSVNSFCGMFHTQLQTCWANCAYSWSVDTLANDG